MNDRGDVGAQLVACVRLAFAAPRMKGLLLQLRAIALQVGCEARRREGRPCRGRILANSRAARKRFTA
eukprot:2455031-Alexandrium_andersonii.AAC.1